MSDASRIVLRRNVDTTTEQVRDARARAWAYVFQCWDAKKGEQHDLITEAAAQAEGANQGREGNDSDVCC